MRCLSVPLLLQVIVVEDENGNIVRETMKDTDTLARYKTMHETLVYLCHLHHDDTEHQMLEKLKLQVSGFPGPSDYEARLASSGFCDVLEHYGLRFLSCVLMAGK